MSRDYQNFLDNQFSEEYHNSFNGFTELLRVSIQGVDNPFAVDNSAQSADSDNHIINFEDFDLFQQYREDQDYQILNDY